MVSELLTQDALGFSFEEFFLPYDLAVQTFIIKLEGIRRQYRKKGLHSPIESVSGRVKSSRSIIEKVGMDNVTIENLESLYDIAGIRIICKYVDDIALVADMLRNRRDVDVIKEKDYITGAKPSGYRSYHIMSNYLVETIDGVKPVRIEFQIRTNAMHLWATVEHRLKYKYKGEIPSEIRERLVSAAKATASLDKELSAIKNEIEDARCEFDQNRNQNFDLLHWNY
ncbi:MAG: GTP pyrophosphokinase family protein [Spirochaetes bacterium]|nr:GTP pyrophosphokinase family protein [Spirochaetota bacterium]